MLIYSAWQGLRRHVHFFQFTVTLRDNGQLSSRQASETANVVINVNRNQFSPLFFNATYYATILETLPVGSSVALVSAQDQDTSVSYHRTYEGRVL